MEASQHYSGVPPPPGNVGPPLRLSPGDVVEAMVAEVEQLWWQVGGGWGAVLGSECCPALYVSAAAIGRRGGGRP